MSPEELASELAAGTLRPAYLVGGEEALLRDDAVAAIEAAVLSEGPRDFNRDRLDGDNVTPGALLDAVRALPVMAPRRLVVLREPGARRSSADALAEALVEAVAEAGAGGTSVLVVVASRIDRRSRWVKAFRGPAALVACDPPKGARAVAAFVIGEARRREIPLGAGAAAALAERVGPQLLLLRQELEKASLLAGPGKTVTRDHVVAVACDVAEEPIWDLTDAIGEGRTGDALRILGRLLGTGSPPPMLLGSLATHFRKLARIGTGGSVSGAPFVRRKLESQARRYSPRRLRSCLSAVHEADEALKGRGFVPPDLALERLVIGLSQ